MRLTSRAPQCHADVEFNHQSGESLAVDEDGPLRQA
jgi:hypothetical protein